jgi:outer membrane lipoprotein-sorting protein
MIRFIFLLVFLNSILFSQELDTILSKHFYAAGQHILDSMQTMCISGTLGDGEQSPSFRKIHKRPGKFILEVDLGNSKIIRAYDGETGWTINPTAGITEPLILQGEELDQLIEQGRFDLHLYAAYLDGRSIEFAGTDTFNNRPVYVLKVEDYDGNYLYQFMDSENFLILKSEGLYKAGGSLKEGMTIFDDIQYTDGIAFPRFIDIIIEGKSFIQYHIDSVQYNCDVDDAIFSPHY